jgi:hypothetical protein
VGRLFIVLSVAWLLAACEDSPTAAPEEWEVEFQNAITYASYGDEDLLLWSPTGKRVRSKG